MEAVGAADQSATVRSSDDNQNGDPAIASLESSGVPQSASSTRLDSQVRRLTCTDEDRGQQPIAELKSGTLRTLADALIHHFTLDEPIENYGINSVQGYLLAHPWFFKTHALIEQVTRPLWEKRLSLQSQHQLKKIDTITEDMLDAILEGVERDAKALEEANGEILVSVSSDSFTAPPEQASTEKSELREACIELMCYWKTLAPYHFLGDDEREIIDRLCEMSSTFSQRFAIAGREGSPDIPLSVTLPDDESSSSGCGDGQNAAPERKSIALHLMGPEQMAEHIAVLDHQLFSGVPDPEMLLYARKARSTAQTTPCLQKAIVFFNGCSQYVTSMVLQAQSSVARAKAFSRFVHVSKALRELRCYNSLMAAVGALKYGSSITRLSQTMALVPQQDMKDLDELSELLQANGNYVVLRKEVQSDLDHFVLPVVGILLKDFVALDSAMPNKVGEEPDRVYNFAKLLHFGLLLYGTHAMQKTPPDVEVDHELLKILQLSFQPHYTEKELYDLSMDREPRTNHEKEPVTEIPFGDWTHGSIMQVDRTTMDSYIEAMVDAVFKRYDTDKSGSISLDEFEMIRSNFVFLENFQVLDANQDGVLSREEMLAYFTKVNFMRALRETFVHNFVETTFFSPAYCAHCKGLLWGLVKQGLKCRSCAITCHRHCQDRIVIDCQRAAQPQTGKKPLGKKAELVTRRSTIQMVADLETGLNSGRITERDIQTRMHDLLEENEALKQKVHGLQRRLDQRESHIGFVRQRTIAFVLEHLDNLNQSRESNV